MLMTMTKKVAVIDQTDSAGAGQHQVHYEPGDIRPEELDTQDSGATA